MAVTTTNTEYMIQTEVWSNQLKEILTDELFATKYVKWLTDFPTGDEFNIPSMGQAVAEDYVENTPVNFQPIVTGNFKFRIKEYKQSGHYITKKMKQDSMYSSMIEAAFVPNEARAIAVELEKDIFGLQSELKAGEANEINGLAHRFVCTGADGLFTIKDIAFAKLALRKANVPMQDLVAIVNPEVAYQIEVLMADEAKLIYNPKWEGIVREGGALTGTQFRFSILGVDFYESEYLAPIAEETIGGKTVTDGHACLVFSNVGDLKPFIGAWRQMPEVDSEYNKDYQRYEYVTTARYGVALYRPENFVVMLAKDAV